MKLVGLNRKGVGVGVWGVSRIDPHVAVSE